MRIRELQQLEEQEGTWCVPRRWSKSLKRWLEYSTVTHTTTTATDTTHAAHVCCSHHITLTHNLRRLQ
jgi:hypothetical protein